MANGVFEALPLTPNVGDLLSAATVERTQAHNTGWAGKEFGWDSLACPSELVLTDMCSGALNGPVSKTARDHMQAWPFGIVAHHECVSLGYSIAERENAAEEQLKVGTSKAVERELQTGASALSGGHFTTPYLADKDGVSLTTAAVSVHLAIAALEQGLADCGVGAQGVIHLTRSAAYMAALDGGLVRKGNSLFTPLGTPVAAGTGYDPAVAKATTVPNGRGGTYGCWPCEAASNTTCIRDRSCGCAPRTRRTLGRALRQSKECAHTDRGSSSGSLLGLVLSLHCAGEARMRDKHFVQISTYSNNKETMEVS